MIGLVVVSLFLSLSLREKERKRENNIRSTTLQPHITYRERTRMVGWWFPSLSLSLSLSLSRGGWVVVSLSISFSLSIYIYIRGRDKEGDHHKIPNPQLRHLGVVCGSVQPYLFLSSFSKIKYNSTPSSWPGPPRRSALGGSLSDRS